MPHTLTPVTRAAALLILPLMCCLALFASASVYAASDKTQSSTNAQAPKSFENEYVTRLFGFRVTVTHKLSTLENGNQQLSFNASAWVGNIDEVTQFRISDDGTVRPQHYSYERRGLGRNRKNELTFDWDKEEVIDEREGARWSMGAGENIQDRISYQVQLQKDLIKGRDNLAYDIADKGELRRYRFEIEGEEELDTPLGKVNTIKVKRSREDSDRATYAWLAKDWNYMLIRLEQHEDGDSHTITINKASLNGETIDQF